MGSTLSNILLHIVFSTKNRDPFITMDAQERLYAYMGGIVRHERCILLEIGGIEDHVHLLVKQHPDLAVSALMRQVKGGSSSWMHDTFPDKPFKWQDGYAPVSVSPSNIEQVRRYIRNQAEHHRKMSFEDELRELLRRNGIEFDERYIWE